MDQEFGGNFLHLPLPQDLSQDWSQGVGQGCNHLKAQLGGDPFLRSFIWLLASLESLLAFRKSHQFLAT